MTLDEAGRIIHPHVGDAELIGFDFALSSATVRIKLPVADTVFALRLANVLWMSFSTNHTQNVIDEIVIVDANALNTSVAPKWAQDTLWTKKQAVEGQDRPPPMRVLTIKPIAGPDLIAIADDVRDINGMAS